MKLAILQDLEQLRLEADVHVADLVEQNGPAIGGFEHARLLLEGSGKGASLIPEELAFHQLRRQGGTIQLQKDFAGARGIGVQLPGQDFLSGAGFTLNQDGDLRPSDVLDQRVDFLHARIASQKHLGSGG